MVTKRLEIFARICCQRLQSGQPVTDRGSTPLHESVGKEEQGRTRVQVSCDLDVLAERDVKGLYKKALAGEIPHFTGVSDPYEPPLHPEVTVNSSLETPDESADRIWATLDSSGLISFDRPTHAH